MKHTVEHASACSHSYYVECKCGEKFWGRTRQEADDKHAAHADTLPQWLHWRFNNAAGPWEKLSEDDQAYWRHEAAAVRRAVERGGFKKSE